MVVTVLVDLALLLALFVSFNISLAWGELGSYPLGGDKSGVAGLGGIALFMMMRWPIVAAALAVAAERGGFAGLPGGKGGQAAIVLGLHLALGILTYQAFEWIVGAIQRDAPGPLGFAWVFGLVLPIGTFGAALFGLHRASIPRHPWITAVVLIALVAGHWFGWRAGYRR
jgi:hypothetical protein